MRVLISGAGIAGPTLAYWLAQYGFEPTIVEIAPKPRAGGHIIDFWGAGFEIADHMGLLPEIRRLGYVVRKLTVVNREDKPIAGFPVDVFMRAARGRYVSLPRGDLAAAILGKIEGKIETIFGDSASRIEQTANSVKVAFASGTQREFDLVVGADGQHSKIRELVFGAESRFEKYLGYQAAAFQTVGYRKKSDLAYVMYTEVGQQIVRFSMRDDRTMFLFTLADDGSVDALAGGVPAQKALLRRRFGGSGWECSEILDALDASSDLYFDRVSQIRMNEEPGLWTNGRVTLAGDAASCVSLLAGQGSALAMVAAYILAGELYRARGDHARAFARYQELFGPFVRRKQDAALLFASAFAPKSRVALFLRNQIFNLMRIPGLSHFVLTREFTDRIALPEY